MVVKMRGGPHSTDIRDYEITSKGLVLGERLTGYEHLITGLPSRVQRPVLKKRSTVHSSRRADR